MFFFFSVSRPWRCAAPPPCHPGRYARTYVLKPTRLVLIFRGTKEVLAPVTGTNPITDYYHYLAPYESSEWAPWGRPSFDGLMALSAVARNRKDGDPPLLGQSLPSPVPPPLSPLPSSFAGSFVPSRTTTIACVGLKRPASPKERRLPALHQLRTPVEPQ